MINSHAKYMVTIFFSLISVNSFAAHGLEPKVTYRDQTNELTCHIYQNYIVHIYGESDNETPILINIYKRKSRMTTLAAEEQNKRYICFENNKQIISVTPEWPHYYFDGIKNDYLFLNSGTSTIRTLYIYNLKTRKQLQNLELKDYVLLDDLLLYFRYSKHITKDDTSYSKCLNEIKIPYGLVIEKLVVFDLKNNIERDTSETQCAYYE